MPQINYAIDPAFFGLPTRDELEALRIWDLHYHGTGEHERAMEYVDRMGIERIFSLDIGGSWGEDGRRQGAAEDARHRQMLEDWSDRMSGIIRIDPSQPEASLEHMENWIRNGPAVGIKYILSARGDVTCSHPNSDAIIELADELDAVIYIHTWLKVGGEPRRPGGGNFNGESTPMDVAELAARFPEVPMVCGHSGGDWEIAVRAIRPHENVLFEYSGSPPWSGMVDYGANWLGADRLVWGGHITSRSYSTELSKVLDANLTDAQRMKVLGENMRRVSSAILERKGVEVTV